MKDRRTFLGNAAAAAVIAKISPLRSFGFTSDGQDTIHPTMSDREKAGLRGSVKQCTEETINPDVQGGPEIRSSQTTEYDPDGRILSTSIGTDGSKWVTTNTYDDNGRLTKTVSGTATVTADGALLQPALRHCMPTMRHEDSFPSRKAVRKLVARPNFTMTSRGAKPRSNTSTPTSNDARSCTSVPPGTAPLK